MAAEDLSAFFGLDHPGVVEATIDGTVVVRGHFLNEYEAALDLVSAAAPLFICPAGSLPHTDPGLVIDIGTDRYIAREVQPDGAGIVSLKLEKQVA